MLVLLLFYYLFPPIFLIVNARSKILFYYNEIADSKIFKMKLKF